MPEPRQEDPERAFGVGQPWSWRGSLHDGELLAQGQVLDGQFLPGLEARKHRGEQGLKYL